MTRGPVTVAVNLGPAPASIAAEGALVLASDPQVLVQGSTVTLPADSVAVLLAG